MHPALAPPRIVSLAAATAAVLVLSFSSTRLALSAHSTRDSVPLMIAAVGASVYIASCIAGRGTGDWQGEDEGDGECNEGKEPSEDQWKRCMPRKIILVRHGESEGNVDWNVMAYKPDEKLELTPKGRQQALEAGKIIRAHVKEGDRVRFYVSPYLRTRQTFHSIATFFGGTECVSAFEEPRLREQDWGNFQNFVEMEAIKAERRRYGTFFYRVPHGESGADVYDRISTFLESLYRSLLTKPSPPSVVVIVTHGLLARLFVMRWFRKSVSEFESWRNLNNCEVLVMERNDEQRRYHFDASSLIHRPAALNTSNSTRANMKHARRESLLNLAEQQEREALVTLSSYFGAGAAGAGTGEGGAPAGVGRQGLVGTPAQLTPGVNGKATSEDDLSARRVSGANGGGDYFGPSTPNGTGLNASGGRGARPSLLSSEHARRSLTAEHPGTPGAGHPTAADSHRPSLPRFDTTPATPLHVLPPLPPLQPGRWARTRSFAGTPLGESPLAYSSPHIFGRNANFDTALEEDDSESDGEGERKDGGADSEEGMGGKEELGGGDVVNVGDRVAVTWAAE